MPELSVGISARIISHETWEYSRSIVDINGWVDMAKKFKAEAERKSAELNVEQSLLDMGLALENLAKGIIISRSYDAHLIDPKHAEEELKGWKFKITDKTKSGSNQEKDINIHNLDLLFKSTILGFTLSAREIDILKELSAYIIWRGRYPTSLDIKRFKSPSKSSKYTIDEMAATAKDIYEKSMAEVLKKGVTP